MMCFCRRRRFSPKARNAIAVMRSIRDAMKQMAPRLDLAIACGNSIAATSIARVMAAAINYRLEAIPAPHQARFRAQVARWLDKMADDRGEPNTKQAGDASS